VSVCEGEGGGGGGAGVVVSVDARARFLLCARVALLIQHATRSHVITYGLSGSTKFFDVMS
jgi:hypothetical protein